MSKNTARYTLFLIFFVSGFTGLIYESLWSHYLKLFLGHAAYAQTLVLVIFMGGMALGAAVVGKISQNLKNLLTGYAMAEIGIGLLALVFHTLFSGLVDLSLSRIMPNLGSPLAVEAYKWGVALVLLLPPSVLLGTTFPLMSGAILRRFPGVAGGNLAMLYFSNSLGAALGALAATFILIGLLGLPGTLQLAGLINLLIGFSVLLLSRVPENGPSRGGAFSTERNNRRFGALFLAAAFVTGAASFVYEVSWIRMLSLVLGSSFHAFELMLSAFIAGLAFGSLAIRRRIDRIANPLSAAAIIQIAMGILAVLTLPIYVYSFEWMGDLVRSLDKNDRGYMLFNLASHGIAFAVMLPATFMAGMTLPLFTHALIRNGHGERSIGAVYAANTVGGIVGVIVAMQFALPNIGLKLTLASGALLDIGLGLLLLHVAGTSPRMRAAALASLLIPVMAVRLVALDGATLASGVYRTGVSQLDDSTHTLFYRDGKTASISVVERESIRSIRTNGKSDAAIEMNLQRPATSDELTMVMAGAVPLAMKPDARKVANIGFGSGLTTHTVLASPNVVELENIEIERAVIEGARAFRPRVERAYSDPRSRIHIEDAKSWFARRNTKFDIIISEPSNPWVSGVSSLFSEEFYAQTRTYLNDGGLLVQWLHLYEFNARLASSVVMALNRHFEDYTIYLTDDSNILIVAIKNGRLPSLSRQMVEGAMSGELSRVGIRSLDDLALRHLGSAAMFNSMLGALGAPRNSDFFPYVELNAPKARFFKDGATEFQRLGIYPLPLIEMLSHQDSSWEPENLTPTDSMRFAMVKQAQMIKAGLLGLPYQDEEVREKMEGWRKRLSACAKGSPEETLSAMQEIALATLAHLDRNSLRALWKKPGWLHCASPRIASRLAVYQAVASRDAPAMLAAAEAALLEGQEDVEWNRYVLDVGVLAARVLADDLAVDRLWEEHGRQLYADGRMSPELVLLLNYKATPR